MRYSTVSTRLQCYFHYPFDFKEVLLVHLVGGLSANSMIIFARTFSNTQRVSSILDVLGFSAIALHGQFSQSERLRALRKFKSKGRNILAVTDVESQFVPLIPLPSCTYTEMSAQRPSHPTRRCRTKDDVSYIIIPVPHVNVLRTSTLAFSRPILYPPLFSRLLS